MSTTKEILSQSGESINLSRPSDKINQLGKVEILQEA